MTLLDHLRADLARGQVLIVVGAGVSIAAASGTPGQRFASWTGLLASGIDRCTKVALPLPSGWADRLRADLASGDLDDLLAVAERVATKLGAPTGGEFRRWLRETAGSLTIADSSVLDALRDLRMPLATTNYDSLLEVVTGDPAVTWRDGARVERLVRGDEAGILHLHGHWQDPESVVLGIRSYEKILGDAHAQNILRTIRTTRTLLFIGFGAGLEDPNFGGFLRWTREIFSGSDYRHYRLCRDQELPDLIGKHSPEERLLALAYGSSHQDLAPFLGDLRPTSFATSSQVSFTTSGPMAPSGDPQSPLAPRIPPPPRCFGRDPQLQDLVGALLADPSVPTPVLGPPGIGKTNLVLTALHEPRVVSRFAARRFFIRCDGATSRPSLVANLAEPLALDPGPHLEARLFQALDSAAPTLLALDNAETPWDGDTLAVEDLLSQLSALPHLTLLASVRGEQRPSGPSWREAIRLRPLDLQPARSAFLAIAGDRHRGDAHLDRLLEAVDCLPLAVILLASQAEALPSLTNLWLRWRTERTALLQRSGGQTRLTSLEVSISLSLESPRMHSPARRLLSVLALLPDGLAPEDLYILFPDDGGSAEAALRETGLLLADEVRLRLLAPVRELLARIHKPVLEDRQRLIDHFLALAHLGIRIGAQGGAEAAQRLIPEWGNLEAVLLMALADPDPEPAIIAVLDVTELVRFMGFGATILWQQALNAARRSSLVPLEAACLRTAGDIAIRRFDNDTAEARYREALPLYRCVGDLVGQANCVRKLGDVFLHRSALLMAQQHYEEALSLYLRAGDEVGQARCIRRLGNLAHRQSDYDAARKRYTEALTLFIQVGDVLGQARCHLRLGNIAAALSDDDLARACFEEALPLYERVGEFLGKANCIKSLGDIALRRSEHDAARARYEAAILIYRRVGSILGLANCIKGLGDIALACSDQEAARSRYEEALALYRGVSSVRVQADCILALGDTAQSLGDHGTARQTFEEALRLYQQIPDPCSIGHTHHRLARLAQANSAERDDHLTAARNTWNGIGRADLVVALNTEFAPFCSN